MTVRCFARRHLVAPRRSSSVIASAAGRSVAAYGAVRRVHQVAAVEEKAAEESAKDQAGQDTAQLSAPSDGEQVSIPTRKHGRAFRQVTTQPSSADAFFATNYARRDIGLRGLTHPKQPASPQSDEEKVASMSVRSPSSGLSLKLLRRKLWTELERANNYPSEVSADQIWRLYFSYLQHRADQLSTNTLQGRSKLKDKPRMHIQVMRAIAPSRHQRAGFIEADTWSTNGTSQHSQPRPTDKRTEEMDHESDTRTEQRDHESDNRTEEMDHESVSDPVTNLAAGNGDEKLYGYTSRTVTANDKTEFLLRVGIIFQRLRQIDPANLPTANHYVFVMRHLAHSSTTAPILILWNEIVGTDPRAQGNPFAVRDEGGAASRAASFALRSSSTRLAEAKVKPDGRMYVYMLMAIQTRLSRCLTFYHSKHKEELRIGPKMEGDDGEMRLIWLASATDSPESIADDVQRTLSSLRQRIETIDPELKEEINLAQVQTIALLRDLNDRGIPLSKLMGNLASRIMRMTGETPTMMSLIKATCGIDVSNINAPQEQAQEYAAPDHFMLETLLRHVAEHDSVSKLVAVYETLSKPLPADKREAQSTEGSLFATNFRGLFRSTAGAGTPAGSIPDAVLTASDVTSGQAVVPNTRVMELLIQSTCLPPDAPSALLAYEKMSGKELQAIAQDHQARQSGAYYGLAHYFVNETLALHEANVRRLASALGTEMGDFKDVMHEVRMLDKKHAAGLPHQMVPGYIDKYWTRLMVLAGAPGLPEAMLASLPKPIRSTPPIDDALLTIEQKNQRKAERQRIERLHASARDFIYANRDCGYVPLDMKPASELEVTPLTTFLTLFGEAQVVLTPGGLQPLIRQHLRFGKLGQLQWMSKKVRQAMSLHIIELRMLGAARAYWVQRLRKGNATDVGRDAPVRVADVRELLSVLDQQHDAVKRMLESMALRAWDLKRRKAHFWKQSRLKAATEAALDEPATEGELSGTTASTTSQTAVSDDTLLRASDVETKVQSTHSADDAALRHVVGVQ